MLNSDTKGGRRSQRVPKFISYPILLIAIAFLGILMFVQDILWNHLADLQASVFGDSYYPVLNILVIVLITMAPALGIIHIIASFYPKSEAEKLFEERESN